MDKVKLAKRHLITIILMFFVLFVISLAITLGIYYSGNMTADYTVPQLVLMSVASAYIPCSVYVGICTCFLRISQFNNKQSVAFVLLFPIILVGVIFVGAVMVVPMIINSIITIIKG